MPGYKRQRTNGGRFKPRGAFQFKAPKQKRYSKIYVKPSQESKFLDGTISLGVAATGGLVEDSLCHIPQGINESQRIGRTVTIHNIHIKGTYKFLEDATESADQCRFILYIDHQANGATASITDILETAHERSFRNLANSGRFTVLRDDYFVMNALTADAASNYGTVFRALNFNWYSKEGVKIEFNSTAGAITELRSNNIGLLWVNGTGTVGLDADYRVRYTDA